MPGADDGDHHRGRVLLQRPGLRPAHRLTAAREFMGVCTSLQRENRAHELRSAPSVASGSPDRVASPRCLTRGSVRRCGRRSAGCTATGGRCRSRCPTSGSGRRPSTTRKPPPREYWDEEYAATTPAGGIVAPEEFNPFAWMTAAGPPAPGVARPGASTDRTPARRRTARAPSNMLNGGMEVRVHGCPHATRRRDPCRHAPQPTTPNAKDAWASCSSPPPEQRWTNQGDELLKTPRDVLIRY